MQIIYSENNCKISSPLGEIESNSLLIKVIAKFLVDNTQVISDISNTANNMRVMTLLWDKEDDFVEYMMTKVIPPGKES
jgi:hypothetical protein